MVSSISGSTAATGSLSSVQGIEQLVTQMTNLERQQVTEYKTQLDNLAVKKGIYSDIQSKLKAVQTAIEVLRRGDDGAGGAFNTFKTTLSGDNTILSASVSSSSKAGAGKYDIHVQDLASVDRYASYRFADTATLNWPTPAP